VIAIRHSTGQTKLFSGTCGNRSSWLHCFIPVKEFPMRHLFRSAVIAGALALSTAAAFAGNEEGNKPSNNIAVTAPPAPQMNMREGRAAAEAPQTPVAHHYRRYSHMRSPGEQQMGNGSNGTNANNGVSSQGGY
jgi:hypothetical protein